MLKTIPFYTGLIKKQKDATTAHILLYGAIEVHSTGELGCIASNQVLAAETGLSKERIYRYLSVMKEWGWIDYEMDYKTNEKRGKITPLLEIMIPSGKRWDTQRKTPGDPAKNADTLLGNNLDNSNNIANDVPKVIKAMESIDPKNKLYYGNKTQRSACEFLIKEYGLETVLGAIEAFPILKTKTPYFPSITTPVELRDKWVKVRDAIQRVKTKVETEAPEVIYGN